MTHDEIHDRLAAAKTIDEKLDAIEIAAEYGFGGCAIGLLDELTDGVKSGVVPATHEHSHRLALLAERFADLVSDDDEQPPKSLQDLLARISGAAVDEQKAISDARVLAEAAAIEADPDRRARALRAARHAVGQAREAAQRQREHGEAEAAKLEAEAARIAALVAQ